jgi:Family of unknown function (DUF5343)
MAAKKQAKPTPATEAKFPYTNRPASLRRMLKDIPQKPKPAKVNKELIRSWGFRDTNDNSNLRVLKSLGLLNANNEPTEVYTKFMNLATGAQVLGAEIRRVYAPLFAASHKPYDESSENLKNLFNIHSGGTTLDFQIQTFKALCESAAFDGVAAPTAGAGAGSPPAAGGALTTGASAQPVVNINLHIHLPENKTRRDYETMIEDIGRYIFGRTNGGRSE